MGQAGVEDNFHVRQGSNDSTRSSYSNSNINEHSNNDAILVILTRAIFSTREHSPCILPSIVSRQTRAVFMARFAVSARSEP